MFPTVNRVAKLPINMSNFSTLSAAQLRRAADIQEQIEALNGQLATILAGNGEATALETATLTGQAPIKTRKKYKLSAAGRAKKVAAQKARWAKAKTIAEPSTKHEAAPLKRRKKMSAASKAKIAAAAKARWAKVKAAKEATAS
jgi:hypothetical protein